MKELTKRQQQVLNFIQQKKETQGVPPTFREIGEHFGFRSPNAVLAHVDALRTKGWLKSLAGRARTLQAINPYEKDRPRPRLITVPIYGTIPAGNPVDAAQESEGCVLIDVETAGIRPNARTFALRVRGDSMVGKGILEGDLAIVEHGVQPRNGDVVAALIDGQVTLKTFLSQRGKPFLRAENPRYPKLIPQEELQIQGVMMALIRKRK
jgi:repressor LexA